jgi:hypothetical protein
MTTKLHYYNVFADIIMNDDIEELEKDKYNALKLSEPFDNNDMSVFFDMSNIPKNIISLDINHKNAIIVNIPKHIKYLFLNNANKFINIPSTVNELYIKTSYYNKFPEVLNLIPYGIKMFTFQARVFDENKTFNFNMLPDSIKKIIIKNPYEKNNKFIINKEFPKLKYIEYHHFINSFEYSDLYNNFDLKEIDSDLYDYICDKNINLYIDY